MFKVNDKGTRTMSMTSFVDVEHISRFLLVFTVDFEQLFAG